MGSTRAYFAKLQGPKLTLVDTRAFVPIVELTEKEATGLTEGYRRFGGNGANRDVYDIAAQIKGDEITEVQGRVGTPCEGDKACSAPKEVPLLPGEKQKMEDARNLASTAKKTAETVREIISFGRNKGAENTAASAAAVEKGLDSTNQLLLFRWKSFNLTTNLPAQVKAQ